MPPKAPSRSVSIAPSPEAIMPPRWSPRSTRTVEQFIRLDARAAAIPATVPP